MRVRVLAIASGVLLAGAPVRSQVVERFDDVGRLPSEGWVFVNNSQPLGTTGWFQGNPEVFPSQAGLVNAYIAANFNNTTQNGTISDWMLTPALELVDGDTMTFYTRTVTNRTFADRLQVRLSTSGASANVGTTATSVGDFATLLLDINPGYAVDGYPNVWTEFTATVAGVPAPTLGRLAFRYFVEDAGSNGANSDYVGVDTVSLRIPAQAAALVVDPSGNRVIEPNQTTLVAPSWRNTSSATLTPTGTASSFGGPSGPAYAINDATAAYGSIAVGATASCTGTGDCYAVTATVTTRPSTHWDATLLETLSLPGRTKTWTLHIGNSFSDVSTTSPFYPYIETLLHKGITGGCGTNLYCPAASATREQMAVFVLVAKEGPGFAPAACEPPNTFTDVPETSPFCAYVEELSNRGVVSGCGNNNYCPTSPVTREQMAVFVLRTLDPALNPPACGTPVFADVPASSAFCRWVEELARRGVVSGCGGGNYCPTAAVSREQMGVFISVTFSLALYGI